MLARSEIHGQKVHIAVLLASATMLSLYKSLKMQNPVREPEGYPVSHMPLTTRNSVWFHPYNIVWFHPDNFNKTIINR